MLHAVCVMSNHWHGVVTDPEARLPEFLCIFHKLLAKCQNAWLGRWENFWSSDKPSVIPLESDEDVIDKMAYAIANPVAAGLVKSPDEWPGVISDRFGVSRSVPMPDVYFDDEGDLPESVELRIVRPPILSGVLDVDVLRRLRHAVADLVRNARAHYAKQGQSFAGREAVLQMAVTSVPHTKAPRRELNPRVAGKSKALRIRAIERMREFVSSYQAARGQWRNGDRNIVFPWGTYYLRVYAGVLCGPPAPA
jgi:putative transposase